MPIYDNEVFGPVLSVVRASTYGEAMDIIASHPLGNGAAIFTRDGGAAKHYADNVQAGMVGINVPHTCATLEPQFWRLERQRVHRQ